MATSDFRKFACSECKRVTSLRRKPQKKGIQQEKIETRKFCKFCRKHTLHRETK